ncbi:hypothetical protein PMZ80_007189 [Knufia obscura]|uniref:Carbohydrate kinase PfkB domain-containing protein n=1 Tax=Knufia obscura TaxID=1635080 RepID=A0ABR0RJI0_9EURO|nr:hypothetical protein PMZ80_007189 [Knufia obscura]
MTTTPPPHRPLLTTLGLAVLDEIHFGNGTTAHNILGGSGSYCTAGARLFSPEPTNISWQVHAGTDFPRAIESQLNSWGINLRLRKSADRLSTRGLLVYEDDTFGAKSFRYTTPVHQVEPSDLVDTPMLNARAIHILASPEKLMSQVEQLSDLRRNADYATGPQNTESMIIWEPAPLSCLPENLSACFDAARVVDVFSPNHIELLQLFGIPSILFDRTVVESLAAAFLKSGVGKAGKGVIVVRASEHGCLIMGEGVAAVWQGPYYDSKYAGCETGKIADTTGAGNAFLGGFAVGCDLTGDLREAGRFGSVAASLMVEQVGLPKMSVDPSTGMELWNGDDPRKRLEALRGRDN